MHLPADLQRPPPGAMSIGRSRYSKIRSKSASEVWTSMEMLSRLPIGAKRRVWRVVNETSVPTTAYEAVPPERSTPSPPNQ
jgi:hypothetical protein